MRLSLCPRSPLRGRIDQSYTANEPSGAHAWILCCTTKAHNRLFGSLEDEPADHSGRRALVDCELSSCPRSLEQVPQWLYCTHITPPTRSAQTLCCRSKLRIFFCRQRKRAGMLPASFCCSMQPQSRFCVTICTGALCRPSVAIGGGFCFTLGNFFAWHFSAFLSALVCVADYDQRER